MSSKLSTKTWVVYKHTSPSNKVYIGITKDIPERRWESGMGYKSNPYFFKAIVKYGWINFKHEIIFEGLSKNEAEIKEIELISKYRSSDANYGYNIDMGGFLHLKYEKERRDKREVKATILAAERERLKSFKYTNKISGRTVYKYDLNGNLLETFNSCKEAAEDAGVPYSSFQRWVRGKHPKKAMYRYSYGSFDESRHTKYKQTYNAKPVDMFDLSLNLIKTFSSIADAGRYISTLNGCNYKTAVSNIHGVCNCAYVNKKSTRLVAYNYLWRYHNENTDNKIA